MARVVQLAATKRGRIAWRIMPNPNRVDAMTDAQVLTLINGPGDSRNLRGRMLRLWSNNGVSIAAPPGCDAHHLILKAVSAEHRRFLAKIGFDIDHPKIGTFLPDSQINGPRAIGQSQAVHTGSHPGYREALKAKVEKLRLCQAVLNLNWCIRRRLRPLAQEWMLFRLSAVTISRRGKKLWAKRVTLKSNGRFFSGKFNYGTITAWCFSVS